jgi:NAD(P)-dependent dehydrogenase (short-subunit alcohol dehydrogenase family)
MTPILDRFSLKGKVILLTGGNGLYGRGLTSDLAEAGAQLIIASRHLEASTQVAQEEEAKGHHVHPAFLDQGDEASLTALCREIEFRFGRLDGLINNAASRPVAVPEAPGAAFAESMRVNATGLHLMHHYFGNLMAQQGSGSIVNIGSIMGMVGPTFRFYEGLPMTPPPPEYFFHKGGMINLTRFYAGRLGPRNVRVNCVSPGGFQNNQPAEFIARYQAETMLGRMAKKDDLGGAVIFLLSDASAYVTGVNLPVDGGYTAH